MVLCGRQYYHYFRGAQDQGAVQGIAGSFGSLASIIGLTVGGILYHFLGGAIFLISAAVMFAVFILSFRVLGIKKDE